MIKRAGRRKPDLQALRHYLLGSRTPHRGSQQQEAEDGLIDTVEQLRTLGVSPEAIAAAMIDVSLVWTRFIQGRKTHKMLRLASSRFAEAADTLEGKFPDAVPLLNTVKRKAATKRKSRPNSRIKR